MGVMGRTGSMTIAAGVEEMQLRNSGRTSMTIASNVEETQLHRCNSGRKSHSGMTIAPRVEEMQLSNCVMAGQSLQMQTPTLLKSLG
jgi:hypothetical protein